MSRGLSKDERPWETLVDFTLDELLAHVRYWMGIQGIDGQPTELHHINWRSESLWVEPGDVAWRELWALDNLIPLTDSDHVSAGRGDLSGLHPKVREAIKAQRQT